MIDFDDPNDPDGDKAIYDLSKLSEVLTNDGVNWLRANWE